MTNTKQPQALANAFFSCSLRKEDARFNYMIEQILQAHSIQPFGTVGRYHANTENPAQSMKTQMGKADMLVVAATSRYMQTDLHNSKASKSISEMIHVESGMAFYGDKPIVVFVEKGTHLGNFLGNVTQYVELDGTYNDLKEKSQLISSLLRNACQKVKQQKDKQFWNGAFQLGVGFLAFVGLASLFPDEE
jgi:hypothetical protein